MTTAHHLQVSVASTLNQKLRLAQVSTFALEAKHLRAIENPTLTYSMTLEGVVWTRSDRALTAVLPISVTIEHKEGEKREGLGLLRSAVRLGYELHPGFADEDEAAVEHFVGIVGWMHAWPYLRADIQDLSTRLGFPPLVLPVLLAGQTADVPVSRLETRQSPPARRALGRKSPARKKARARP